MLHGAVQQFMRDVVWGELDYLVVDLPPGHRRRRRSSMAQSVPVAGAVVVTTPQGVSVSDVRKAVGDVPPAQHPGAGRGREHELLRVRPLPASAPRSSATAAGARMAEDMGIPFLGEVPIDTRVRSGGDEGQPIVAAAPDAPGRPGLRRASRARWRPRSRSRTCACCGSSRPRSSVPRPIGWTRTLWFGRASHLRMATGLLLSLLAAAAASQPAQAPPTRPEIAPVRVSTPPVIDGVLEDEAWREPSSLSASGSRTTR